MSRLLLETNLGYPQDPPYPRVDTGAMSPEKLGSLIGAVFGLVFVVVNTGSVPTAAAVVLRVLGVSAFLAVLIGARRPAPGGGR